MGACNFIASATGATTQAAFDDAVFEACIEHGAGGYTGTIAEKLDFTLIELPATPEGQTREEWARQYSRDLLEADDERINDKWGPAGAFDMGDGSFFFFGWASS
jgi:hypothetical protein